MKLSDYVIDFLKQQGCSTIFGYPGGAITHLLDSIGRREDMTFVGCCHEQGAAFAAEGYARVTGRIGVAMATSGPGATNLLTGVGSAYFDSIPCLYLTGQVNTYEYKGNLGVRQLGFQETDIVSIAAPITKYAARVTSPQAIRQYLEKAVAVATQSRPGPVLLDIPMDVQRAEVDPETLPALKQMPSSPARPMPVQEVAKLLGEAQRPLMIVGGGVRIAGAAALLKELTERTQIPVVCSLMGLDSCAGLPGFFGMLGAYGCRAANLAAANSDLILALGTRLDSRQTGTAIDTFARCAKLIRVDVDPLELYRTVKPDQICIQADAAAFLTALLEELREQPSQDRSDWLGMLKDFRQRYPCGNPDQPDDPNRVVEQLSAMTTPEDIICLDVGQNQMWGAQSLALQSGQRLLTSGGMGSMGFALPAAIGAWYAAKGRRVIALSGDGGLQMNIQELGLAARLNIPVKILVLNNNALGMIRHFQELYFGNRYFATINGYGAPDFCAIAKAYGIPTMRIEDYQLEQARALLEAPGPALIDIALPRHTYVIPKLGVGLPIEDQEPLLPREELLGNLVVPPAPASGITQAKDGGGEE